MKKFDLQDALIVLGFVALDAGAGMIYRPAALILAGLIFFGFAFLIEISKRADKAEKKG